MRKDVKVGLVLSLVVVVVAGLYYVGRDKKGEPVKLDDAPAVAEKAPAASKGPVADARDARPKPAAQRPGTPNRPVVPPSNPRVTPKPPAPGTLAPPTDSAANNARTSPPRQDPKPETVTASGENPAAPANPSAKDPVASASPSPDSFNNLFNFGKEPGESKPDEPSSVKISDPQPAPTGSESKPKDALPGATPKTAPPAPPSSGKERDSGEPVRTHKVAQGDSYALLAETYYGSQRYAQFLMDANPQHSDPTKLREGVVLKIPARPNDVPAVVTVKQPAAGAASSTAKEDTGKKSDESIYVVQEDDTLYGIASRELGKGTRWPELLELNKDILKGSPERLRVGQKLKLPATEKKP